MSYTHTKKFRGQPVQIAGNRAHITIRVAQLQRGTRPTVGLSDALLEFMEKRLITLYVSVLTPEVSFKTTAKDWYKTSKKEEQTSYFGVPWYIYRGPIPDESFEKKTVMVEMSEEEKEKYEYYKQHSDRFFNR